MTQINFVVGLTDVEDYDGFIYDIYQNDSINNTNVIYNIQKASTDIEKESIIWSLDMSLDATKNMITAWEHTIRRPHLNMIGLSFKDNLLMPVYKDYDFSIGFVNLIPLLPGSLSVLTDNDYNSMIQFEQHFDSFGDMFLDMNSLISSSTIYYENTLEYAFRENNIKSLQEHTYPYVMPRFTFDFCLRQRRVNTSILKNKHSYEFMDWVEKNKDVLEEKGYTLDKPYCNIGRLKMGSLIGDPWEEYQKLQKYNRICRTSMVLVEE